MKTQLAPPLRHKIKARWRAAWSDAWFRTKIFLGLLTLVLIFASYPAFFRYIENRNGVVLYDWLLGQLPALDVSWVVFPLIWGVALLYVFRAIAQPRLLTMFLGSYVLLSVMRMITILLVPLNPPPDLIELIDPISNVFYTSDFITKDLFFSGHTSTVFLMYLCLKKTMDKRVALLATIGVGLGVLVQHVHYTIDVLAAPVFAWLCWRINSKL